MQVLERVVNRLGNSWHTVKLVIQANTQLNLEIGKGAVEPKRTYRQPVGSVQRGVHNATDCQRAIHLPEKYEFIGNQKTADKNTLYEECSHPQTDPRNMHDLPFASLPPAPYFTVLRLEESDWDENFILVKKSKINADNKKKLLARE